MELEIVELPIVEVEPTSTCIGDGRIAEVFNGLFYNENLHLKNDKNICITPIATCSGNALANELKIESILHGFETCINEWGAISTIDLESESYRWMGSMRFTLKTVSEVAWSSHYKARIYFKPIDAENKNNNESDDENWWHKLPDLSLEKENDNEKEDENKTEYPSDWICVEGEFGLVCVTNLQWIAEDTNMGGKGFNAKTNTLRLVWNQKTGRVNYASALLGLDKGKHLDLEYVKYYDVEKLVIEPLSEGPPIDVDVDGGMNRKIITC